MFIEEDKTTFNDNFKFTIIVWIEQKTNNAKIGSSSSSSS